MHWRKKKGEPSALYGRLIEEEDESMKGPCKKDFVSVLRVLSKLTSSRAQGRSMQWRRKGEPSVPYERLVEELDESKKGPCKKGYVRVLAVSDDGHDERFLVHVTLFKHPCMEALLEVAKHQFGHRQEGVLRLPCSAECFRHVIDLFPKH